MIWTLNVPRSCLFLLCTDVWFHFVPDYEQVFNCCYCLPSQALGTLLAISNVIKHLHSHGKWWWRRNRQALITSIKSPHFFLYQPHEYSFLNALVLQYLKVEGRTSEMSLLEQAAHCRHWKVLQPLRLSIRQIDVHHACVTQLRTSMGWLEVHQVPFSTSVGAGAFHKPRGGEPEQLLSQNFSILFLSDASQLLLIQIWPCKVFRVPNHWSILAQSGITIHVWSRGPV